MNQGFNNYSIKDNKVILLLEHDIYRRDMINGAGQAMAGECSMTVTNEKNSYQVILTPAKGKSNLEELAVTFNDALISQVSLFPN